MVPVPLLYLLPLPWPFSLKINVFISNLFINSSTRFATSCYLSGIKCTPNPIEYKKHFYWAFNSCNCWKVFYHFIDMVFFLLVFLIISQRWLYRRDVLWLFSFVLRTVWNNLKTFVTFNEMNFIKINMKTWCLMGMNIID